MFSNQEPNDTIKSLLESDDALRKLYEALDETLEADESQPAVVDFLNPNLTESDPNSEEPPSWEDLETELEHAAPPPADFVISDRLQQAVDHWEETINRLAKTNQAPKISNLISELLNWDETAPDAETVLDQLQHQVEACLLGTNTSSTDSPSSASSLSNEQKQQALIYFLTHVQVEVQTRGPVEPLAASSEPAVETEPDPKAEPLRSVTVTGVDGQSKVLEMEVKSPGVIDFDVLSIKDASETGWLEISGTLLATKELDLPGPAEVHVLYEMYDAFSKELKRQGSAIAGRVELSAEGQGKINIYVPKPQDKGEFEFELECFATRWRGLGSDQFPVGRFPSHAQKLAETASTVKWDWKKDRVKDVCTSKTKPRITWPLKKTTDN